MSDERPDALLRSALEKIVYFEARAEQLHGELDGTREEVEHLKRELSETHQRELEMRRELAELEVRVGRAQAERDELNRLNQALRLERHQLMDKLLDASRIHASGQVRDDDEDDDLGFDLASFISQLRSEAILRGEAAPVVAPPVKGAAVPVATPAAKAPVPWEPAPKPERPPRATELAADAKLSPLAREAQRMSQEGRLRVSPEQLAELSAHVGFTGSSDETLFGFSVRELSAPDAAARVRAAERLKALSQPAAAPALASALHAETDPAAQVAMLQAFAGLCREEGASVVSPLLASPVPEVRIAALKAMLTLAPRDAAPHLAQAMKDADRSVRRRASLLALGLEGETARRLGEDAIHDADSEVRSLAALALGAGAGENARVLLLQALDDAEPRVRKAAAQSLSRILGQDVSAVVSLDDAHRRREIRRLATLPVKPVRARLEPRKVAAAPIAVTVAQAAVPVQAVAVMQAVSAQAPASMKATASMQAVASMGPPQAQVVAPVQVVTSAAHGQPVASLAHGQAPVPVRALAVGAGPVSPPSGAAQPAPTRTGGAQVVSISASDVRAPARLSPVQAALVAMGATPSQGGATPQPVASVPAHPAVAEPRAPHAARPGPSPVEALCSEMLAEVRAAVRGRSFAELASGLSASAELAQEALALLVARGAILRRGHKYFAA